MSRIKGKWVKVVACAAALACLQSGGTKAATFSQNMNLRLAVSSTCAMSITDMNFGNLTQVVGTETATSTVVVNCTPGTLLYLSFQPTFSVANTSKASFMSNPAGNKINFTMSLAGYWGYTGGWTTINGRLAATPGVASGAYKSVETLYVIY